MLGDVGGEERGGIIEKTKKGAGDARDGRPAEERGKGSMDGSTMARTSPKEDARSWRIAEEEGLLSKKMKKE